MSPGVEIADVIKTLKESQNDPDAAYRRLSRQAEERENEAQALRAMAAAIDLLRPSVERQLPPSHLKAEQVHTTPLADGDDTRPVGIDAVRRVMREGGIWSAKDVLEELKRRGWEPRDAQHPQAATEAAVNRLYRVKKELDRVGRGKYRYKGIPSSPSTETLADFAKTGRAEP
jgi:hypothetical protein